MSNSPDYRQSQEQQEEMEMLIEQQESIDWKEFKHQQWADDMHEIAENIKAELDKLLILIKDKNE